MQKIFSNAAVQIHIAGMVVLVMATWIAGATYPWIVAALWGAWVVTATCSVALARRAA